MIEFLDENLKFKHALNLKSNKILRCKTRNVFFEKRAGIAEIKKEDALKYCKEAFPNEYDNLQSYYEKHPEDLFLDFENHFTCIEDLYKPYLENVIVRRAIESIQEKTFISYFLEAVLILYKKALLTN